MQLEPKLDIDSVATTARVDAQLDTAPARFLDHAEGLRMDVSNDQLIHEAIECNHAGVGRSTLARYRCNS